MALRLTFFRLKHLEANNNYGVWGEFDVCLLFYFLFYCICSGRVSKSSKYL